MAPRKAKSAPESLGTFEEREARAIASMLNAKEGIRATVSQLHVGSRDEQPTVWWHVNVPTKSALGATTWLRGYKAGRLYQRATDHGLGRMMSFADSARELGYAEYVFVDPKE